MKFTTSGGVSRYSNDRLTGPPAGAIAVIVVVMTVAVMIWQRGYRPTMAVLTLLMALGSGLAALRSFQGVDPAHNIR